MKELSIGTYNIKNSKINRLNIKNNSKLLKEIIEKENLDILGTQELTFNFTRYLKNNLKEYKIYGDYVFGNIILKRLPFNENNVVITKKDAIKLKTYRLPFISLKSGFVLPRIASVLIVEDKSFNKICIINTHLEHKVEEIRIRQLKVIKNLVLKYIEEFPTILMGDFNMDLSNKIFKDFIKDVSKYIKRVETKEPTWNPKGRTLDHIFIPNNWDLSSVEVIKNELTNKLSDHNLLKIKVKY